MQESTMPESIKSVFRVQKNGELKLSFVLVLYERNLSIEFRTKVVQIYRNDGSSFLRILVFEAILFKKNRYFE